MTAFTDSQVEQVLKKVLAGGTLSRLDKAVLAWELEQ